MTDPLPVIVQVRQLLGAHRAQALQATEVRITRARRRDLLRECGLDRDGPDDEDGEATVWGVPLVLDDSLPEDPGFAVLTVYRGHV